MTDYPLFLNVYCWMSVQFRIWRGGKSQIPWMNESDSSKEYREKSMGEREIDLKLCTALGANEQVDSDGGRYGRNSTPQRSWQFCSVFILIQRCRGDIIGWPDICWNWGKKLRMDMFLENDNHYYFYMVESDIAARTYVPLGYEDKRER